MALFNEHADMLPYRGRLNVSELQRFFRPPGAPFEEPKLLVCLVDGEPVAFAQTAVGEGRHEFGIGVGERVGLLRFFLYRRAHRRAAQALLSAVDDDFRDRGTRQVVAFDRLDYHFLPCTCLPDSWLHVLFLLGEAGYETRPVSIASDLDDLPTDPPDCPVDGLRTQVEQLPSGERLPDGWIEVFDGDERVAATKMNCFAAWLNGLLAEQTAYVDGFGVADEYRGRGLARYCLLYALWVMRQWGFTRASLAAEFANHHALLLYDSLGYRKIFTQYVCTRTLD